MPKSRPPDPSAPGSAARPAARVVCRCLGISSLRLERALAEGVQPEVGALADATGAGMGCGTCHPELEELVRDATGAPVSDEVRRRNRNACTRETRGRVERALLGAFRGEATLERIEVDGLRVELLLTLDGTATPFAELRERVGRRLRRLVCKELDVRVREAMPLAPPARRFR